ncbi:HAD-IA family hydrolase [Luteococcus peritonei]|uniref:HAD-IA family hydrolase n=1 Tax=Luteococcus peritonei TaxID=88874 RepID=A0ABW4RS41_9ACTN
MTIIDKVALVHVRDGRLLTTRSAGRERCYLPGGKREPGEDDLAALTRELAEELGVQVDPATVRPWGVFTHEADAQAAGTVVRTTAMTADVAGEPVASAEVDELAWLAPEDRDRMTPTIGAVVDDLLAKGFFAQDRAVLFDLDDTLVATREVKWEHHRFVAREHYGIDLDDETLARHWGEPFGMMLGHLYRDAASTEEMVATNHASAHLYPKTTRPGAVELVTDLLDAGIPVGVVTSTLSQPAADDLRRCGFPVDRLFTVQGADRSPVHKPDPAVFTAALDTLRCLGIERVSYVGDAVMDAQAAAGAGLDFVAVTTGMVTAEAFPGVPVVASIAEAGPYLGL